MNKRIISIISAAIMSVFAVSVGAVDTNTAPTVSVGNAVSTSNASTASSDVTASTSSSDSTLAPDQYTLSELENNFEYKGSGMVIALIDTGFNIEHECFTMSGDGRLTEEYVNSVELNVKSDESFYINAKIPFAYNYADDNTEVSGLSVSGTANASVMAGNNLNSPEHSSGTAPEAQLLLMKVFSDKTASADSSDVVAAIQDAVSLGADAICLPVSENSIYSYSGNVEDIYDALNKAKESGVMVVTSVGDSVRLGEVSIYNKDAGIISALCENPDIGNLSAIAAQSSVISVGSAESNVYSTECFTVVTDNEQFQVPYSDSNAIWILPSDGMSFSTFLNGEYEYVFVPRYGRVEDLVGIDLTGKIAVVERGVINFSEKCNNAAKCGAVGVIIYDYQPDPDSVLTLKMDLSEATIPAVIISGENADKMRESGGRIVVSKGDSYVKLNFDTPTVSSFSARGSTSDLLLKPDITVVGEDIECASYDGGYSVKSSTSLSAAKLCGMLVCVKERLVSLGFTDTQASGEAMNLLASSAQIMNRADGSVYSPRRQGSGNAMLSRALSADIYMASNGSHKIELGEISDYYFSFDVTLTNLSERDIECEIDSFVGSDGYKVFTYNELNSSESELKLSDKLGVSENDEVGFTEPYTLFKNAHIFPGAVNINMNLHSEDYQPLKFTVKAGKTATFHLTVLIDKDKFTEYNNIFKNGWFVEGYVCAKYNDTQASIPFMGYMGDFSKPEAVDCDIYGGNSSYADSTYLYRDYSSERLSGRLILGADPFDKSLNADREYICFSPTADINNADIYLNFALLRDVSDVTVSVYNSNELNSNELNSCESDSYGSSKTELVAETHYGDILNTYVDYLSGLTISPQIYLWDGRMGDNRYYICPDGEYTVEVNYNVGNRQKSLSYIVYLDSTSPTLNSYEFSVDDDGYGRFTFQASDNFMLSESFVYDEYARKAEVIDGYYDVSRLGRYIYIELYDCAMNCTVERLDNPYFVEMTY